MARIIAISSKDTREDEKVVSAGVLLRPRFPGEFNPAVETGRVRRAATFALGAIGIGLVSSGGAGRRFDASLFRQLNRARGSFADRFFGGITELGSIFGSAGAAAALSLAGCRRAAARGLAAAGTTWVIGQVLKKAVLRARPYDEAPGATRLLIGRPRGTSWPSSHPAVLLSFVTVIERDLRLVPPVRKALAAIVGAVGVSRVYLGVHYPSDVVGGLLVGRAVGLAWPGETNHPSVE